MHFLPEKIDNYVVNHSQQEPKILQELQLTMLLERMMRGDLIETYNICSGLLDYGKHFFCLSSWSVLRILKDTNGESILAN